MFNVGEGRCHIRGNLVVRGGGDGVGGRRGKYGAGDKCAVGGAGRNGGGVRAS
jgi:hypothetical protein